jgi:hypothetical protein
MLSDATERILAVSAHAALSNRLPPSSVDHRPMLETPLCVAGLALPIYRDTTGRFEFADSDFYWLRAGRIDLSVRLALAGA